MKLPALKEIIEERKTKAIDSLSDSYAKNRLPLEEYERLVEYISKVESERELVVVEKIVAEHGKDEKPVYDDDDDDDEDEPESGYVRSSRSTGNVAILSDRTFSGPLKSGTEVVSILGGASITVRKADLAKRQTTLNVVSILSDIVVYVESGIRVRNKAIPVLSSSSVNRKVNTQAQQDEPELVIKGIALLGSVNVKLMKEER